MFKELKNSGLPIYYNEETGLLAFSAPLIYDGYGRKKLKQMNGLFEFDKNNNPEETIYDVYRNIHLPEDKELLLNDKFSYDITIVKQGMVGKERKKTSGHYHCWNEMHTSTYPEVYEVISGTAIYILQRADNFEDTNYDNLKVDDVIIVKVKAGQAIIIPPNYGHCSINGGDGDLIFSNLAYKPCSVDYAPVRYYHGLGAYIGYVDGKITVKKNNNYVNLPELKFAEVRENENLGIIFNKPVYQSYKENPKAFDFLGDVDKYTKEIMNMLIYKEEL